MGVFTNFFGDRESDARAKALGKLAFLEVDMHNHLLPGIDDGAQSVGQSIRLINGLTGLGFRKLICTPHIMAGMYPNTKSTIAKAHGLLGQEMERVGTHVELGTAAEHLIDEGLASLIQENNLCLLPGDHVLIEMTYLGESQALFQTITDIQNLGYKPILAHPERYSYYHGERFDMYQKIKDAGCMLQLNLLSISRYYGPEVKTAAMELIKMGMYDFVGTDLHHGRQLEALQDVVMRYPVQEMLESCPIKNSSL